MRRACLLIVGGEGGFSPPPSAAEVFTLSAPPDGAWPSTTDAFYHGGVSYYGYANSDGDIVVGTFDHSTGAVGANVVGGPTSPDQHNSPAILRRSSDGRLVTVFSSHNSADIYRRVSTNPDDPTSWGTADNIDASIGGTGYTYSALFQLNDETNDPIYLFVRDIDGAGSNWELVKSTDGGSTWGTLTNLTFGNHYYGRCFKTSESRLDFAFTDGSLASEFASVYHMYYEGGDYFDSEGNDLGSPPFDITDMTLVYDGSSAGARFPNSIVALADDDIAVAFPVQTGTPTPDIGTDGDYIYCRWDGATWDCNPVATAVGMTTVAFTEGGLVIDPTNLNRVIASIRDGSDVWRIYECLTANGGTTWSLDPLTSAGDEDRYPWFISGYQPELEFIWQKGEFVDQDDFTVGIEGYGVPV